jgi:hypothetical protein
VRLVFVADEIPPSLQRLVEFLNEQMPRVEVLAVEIRQYRAAGRAAGAVVPRLIGQTSRAQAAKEPSAPIGRRSTPWTIEDVLESVAQAGTQPAAVARDILGWATAHADVKITGGTGLQYPSATMSADTGRSRDRFRGVLSIYGSPHGGRPTLEIRIKRMCRTPPYGRAADRAQLVGALRSLGIARLDSEGDLAAKRPNIFLDELTSGQIQRLLSLVDQWIKGVQEYAAEPDDTYDPER